MSINLKDMKIIKENNEAALIDIGDGVACLQFKTKSNTITDDVMDMMHMAVEEVEKNYVGLVIGNESKNFSAGANLMVVAKLIADKNWTQLGYESDKFHQSAMKLKYCKKPVVAAPHGMTLGGGAEITMHCHAAIAFDKSYIGLVEAGVGLVPAGGGVKELLFRSIENLDDTTDEEIIFHLKKALNTLMTAKVSRSGQEAIKQGFLRESDEVIMSKENLIEEAKEMVLSLSKSDFKTIQKKDIRVVGTSGKASLQNGIDSMLRDGLISEYDALIGNKLAYILTGGDVPAGTLVTEEQILELEKEAFVSLCKEEKTLQRIEHMLKTGKPLRN